MKIGLGATGSDVGRMAGQVAQAEADGFNSMWFSGTIGLDALTVIAVAGQGRSSAIELGTGVVQTYPRHPVALAQQTVTVVAALGPDGPPFTLGIGVSHKPAIENYGYSYDKPAAHMRDYLEQLNEMFGSERTPYTGQILVAALAPLMLRATGELASGSITWMANQRAIGDLIAPTMAKAAESAGRPAPRVVAGLPVCVTDDPEGARGTASQLFAGYGMLPNYRRVLDRGGAAGPGDVAVVGDEQTVATALESYIDAGATDIWAAVYPHGDDRSASRARTRALLKSLL